jgi:hypothetical protein
MHQTILLRQYMTLCERITLTEAQTGSYRLFHGTNAQIDAFRFDDLRHRTGTPGTLAFTTSIKTAKIYGGKVYQAMVSGTFGDYQSPEDVEKVFEWRYRIEASRDRSRFAPKPDRLEIITKQLRQRIGEGRYEMWENVGLWRDMGWDGAWCHESMTDADSRNLIVGRTAHIQMIG